MADFDGGPRAGIARGSSRTAAATDRRVDGDRGRPLARRSPPPLRAKRRFLNGSLGITRLLQPSTSELRARLAAGVFLSIGGPAVVLGMLDALTAPDIEYRLLGLAFTLAGANLLAAALCLLLPGLTATWGRTVGISASVAGVAIGIYLTASQLGDPTAERLLLWSLIVVASATTVTLLPRADSPVPIILPDSVHRTGVTPAYAGQRLQTASARAVDSARAPAQRVMVSRLLASAGVSASLVLGIFQFWYSNDYVPSALGAALTISAHMQDVGVTGGLIVVTADVTLKNATNTRVQVISSLVTVTRSAVSTSRDATDRTFEDASGRALQTTAEALTPYSLAVRYARNSAEEVVETGRVVPDGWSFEPGEEYSGRFTSYVPNNSASSVVHLFVDIVVAKGLHLWLADSASYGPRLVSSNPYEYEVSEWPIQRLSHIRALTRGDQAATVVVLLTEPAAEAAAESRRLPGLYVCIDRRNRLNATYAQHVDQLCPGGKRQHDLAVFYGVLRDFTAYDLALPGAAGPTAASAP